MMIIMVTILLFLVHLYVLNAPSHAVSVLLLCGETGLGKLELTLSRTEVSGDGFLPSVGLQSTFLYRKAVFCMRLSFTM